MSDIGYGFKLNGEHSTGNKREQGNCLARSYVAIKSKTHFKITTNSNKLGSEDLGCPTFRVS